MRRFKKLFRNRLILILIFLFILNIAQFSYFYFQNRQLENRIASIDKNLKNDLKDTKEVVTELSKYFEGKGNLTIAALLETVDQLQKDEAALKATIDTTNNNVNVANNNSNIANSNYIRLQTQICILSNGIFCK